jgi:hypothetical protein
MINDRSPSEMQVTYEELVILAWFDGAILGQALNNGNGFLKLGHRHSGSGGGGGEVEKEAGRSRADGPMTINDNRPEMALARALLFFPSIWRLPASLLCSTSARRCIRPSCIAHGMRFSTSSSRWRTIRSQR